MKIKNRLTSVQRKIVREIVREERGEGLSPYMRLAADMAARDLLREEHGIRISLRKLERIA